MGRMKVILQRMNKQIFTKPEELMENIIGVTSYLREKIIENGGDPDRETLNLIPTVGEKPYYIDSKGDYWRSYIFITDATSYDQVEKPEDFYQTRLHLAIFRDFSQIIRRGLYMKLSRASMTRRLDFRLSVRQ